MKKKLLYFLGLGMVIASGCNKTTKLNIPPALTPGGTFSGKFTLYHQNSKTGKTDSSSAILQLSLETATGFKVTGDTATLHAGSYGSYAVSASTSNIGFEDKTYPTTGTPKKIHLDGIYDYLYDGTTLQMAAYGPLDTLTYYYNLKKTGN
jgi:hypothetical protein